MLKIDRSKMKLALVALFALAMLCGRLRELPLRDPDEGRNSEVAREMALTGSWLVPTLNGLPYLDKPAFFFKTVALSFQLFGQSEWAARLPSVIFGIATLVLAYFFCRSEYNQKTAVLSILVVASSPLFFALARHVIFDMTLAFFVCASIFAGYFAEKHRERFGGRLYLLSAALAGLATLVKGPVGFCVPLLVLAAFNIFDGRSGWVRRLFHPRNLLIFLAITLPWFIALSLQRPDFPRYGLVEETFSRFTTGSARRRAPFYYYALVILGGMFAWSMVLPQAVIEAWRRRQNWTSADRLLIAWACTVTIFFSMSQSKLPHYLLSVIVALGILVARLFALAFLRPDGRPGQIINNGLINLATLSFVLTLFLAIVSTFPDLPFKILHIKSAEFERVTMAFPSAALITAGITCVAVLARWRRDMRLALAAFILLPVGVLTVGFRGIVEYSEASSSRSLARGILKLSNVTDVACLQCFPCGLPFYLQRKVFLVSGNGAELTSNYIIYSLPRSESWPDPIIRPEKLEEWLLSHQGSVFLVSNDNHKPKLNELALKAHAAVSPLIPGWWGLFIQ